MNYNIGLNVVEVNGTGAPAIAGAATSVAAFNIWSVVATETTSAPLGYSTETGPLTITTSWFKSNAATESAAPIRPLEALVR